ncbi:MAG: hypothetical protein HYZ74_08630 [Elusimicrobia bacterium]|nr:hypothetical protein [Elusimicrobiota bacterium]
MRFATFCLFLFIFAGAWTLLSVLLTAPAVPWINREAGREEGLLNGVASLRAWIFNLLTLLPQPIIVAAATVATVERHPDAWRWLYFWAGLSVSQPLGAAREWRSLGVRELLLLFVLNGVYLACYFVPSLIPQPLWTLGSWIGR